MCFPKFIEINQKQVTIPSYSSAFHIPKAQGTVPLPTNMEPQGSNLHRISPVRNSRNLGFSWHEKGPTTTTTTTKKKHYNYNCLWKIRVLYKRWDLEKNLSFGISYKIIWMFLKIWAYPPKSSILIGFFSITHPFWGTPILGNTYISLSTNCIFQAQLAPPASHGVQRNEQSLGVFCCRRNQWCPVPVEGDQHEVLKGVTPPRKLTCQWNITIFKRRYIFKWLFFSIIILVFRGVYLHGVGKFESNVM